MPNMGGTHATAARMAECRRRAGRHTISTAAMQPRDRRARRVAREEMGWTHTTTNRAIVRSVGRSSRRRMFLVLVSA
jgi:hypothetical protein